MIMAREKILVVDDEEDILELVRYNLSKERYRVTSALSGEIALQKAREEHPDLILLDLMLPGLDGLSVCRELKRDPAIGQYSYNHAHCQRRGRRHCRRVGIGR